MISPPRIVDIAIGLSILGWATAGTWSNLGQRPLAILVVTSLLHFVVGILFMVRRSPSRQGDWKACLIAIPAVLVGGWVFKWAPHDWNIPTQVLFVTGGVLAILSFAFLGRCFSILPAIRGIEIRGPYSIVRHPAYLGELAMVVACVLAAQPHRDGTPWEQLIVFIVALTFFVARILAEERLLLSSPAYQHYRRQVRWRLVPLVW